MLTKFCTKRCCMKTWQEPCKLIRSTRSKGRHFQSRSPLPLTQRYTVKPALMNAEEMTTDLIHQLSFFWYLK